MDITFKCPKCHKELEVSADGAGLEIPCPVCEANITIPEVGDDILEADSQDMRTKGVNPIATSAAAQEAKHFAVPSRKGAAEVTIRKANKPLEIAAKESDRKMRIKVVRRADCVELGHDKFDETVSDLLQKIEEKHVLGVHPVSYTHLDPSTQKLMEDYGVLIVYRG